MTNLERFTPNTVATIEEPLDDSTRALLEGSISPSTRRAYMDDLRSIEEWTRSRGVALVPAHPSTVANYVGAMRDRYAPATIERRVATWSVLHEANEVENPCRSRLVRQTLKGLRREAPRQRVAQPLLMDDLLAILDDIPTDSLVGLRDRALLLVGFTLGRRRSELVALDLEDLQRIDQPRRGYSVTIQRSKTDQEGEGQVCWLPRSSRTTCPATNLERWLEAAEITSGALFRSVTKFETVGGRLSDRSVSTILSRRADEAGLPPGQWTGHSLRSGFATEQARRGKSTRSIARQGGWSPTSPVIHRYVRVANPWDDNAVGEGDWL
jgi:site-specific recombinase XerD